MAATELPSGRQHVLAWGDQEATVVEVGAGLRAYSAGGLELFDGYGPDQRCGGARGQPLVPWPNRLRDGRYRFAGKEHQLALTEPGRSNAIHGLVRWSNWEAVERSAQSVVMAHVLHPQPGYPFVLSLRLRYSLGPAGLTVELEATNVGPAALPFGAGAHPYLALGTAVVDPLVLQAPGATRMVTDDRQIPVSSTPVDGTPFDFRQPRPIGDAVLDTGYADLERDGNGRAWVDLATPDGERRVSLWMGPSFGYLMLFTGDTLAREDRRRTGLGVEPMTCPPNALASGEAIVALEPGASSTAAWGIVPGGRPPGS